LKKKIVLVGPIPPPFGGIPKYVNDLYYSSFLKNNYNIELFNTAIPKSLRRHDKLNERSYFSFLSDGLLPGFKLIKYTLSTFKAFRDAILLKKPQIVQVFTSSFWGFWRSCIYILVAKHFKVKVIFSLLNAIDVFWDESSFLSRYLIRAILNRCDYILVQSKGIKNFIKKITKTPVVAIYNGINLKEYDNLLIKNQLGKSSRVQIVFLGALTKNKGVFDLINASSMIDKDNIFYIFIGSGDIKRLKKYGKKKGIYNQLVFKGNISDKEKVKILMNSNVFVLPSYAEGQPLAILEAMCSGLPIISTNVGSIPEIIKEGINGFIVEPGDVENLAEKIKFLIENKKVTDEISENNYVSARKLYNIERLFIETSEIYNSLLSSRFK